MGSASREALEILGDEIENIRAAWDWAVAQEESPRIERALEGLAQYYHLRGWFQEGETMLGRAAEELSRNRLAQEDRRHVIHKLSAHRGAFLGQLGRYDEAETLLQSSLQGLQSLDDAAAMVPGLNTLSWINSRRGNYAQAQDLAARALTLAQAKHLRSLEAESLNNLGAVCFYQVDFDRAQEYYTQALHIQRELGDRWGESITLGNLGLIAYERNQFKAARRYFEQALQLFQQEIGSREREGWYLDCLGMTTLEEGDHAASLDY